MFCLNETNERPIRSSIYKYISSNNSTHQELRCVLYNRDTPYPFNNPPNLLVDRHSGFMHPSFMRCTLGSRGECYSIYE